MISYIIKKIGFALLVIVIVFHLVFLLIHIVPGDPAINIAGPGATPEQVQAIRARFHLDEPLYVQYGYFWKGVAEGTLGYSYSQEDYTVISLIKQRYPFTLILAIASMFVAFSISIPLGIIAARRQYTSVDQTAMVVSLLGISIPNFWLGPMLLLIFYKLLGLLPGPFVGDLGDLSLSDIILPAITLGTALAAMLSRVTRASMIDTLKEDYIRTARAKGLSEMKIVYKHGLRNAVIPTISIAGIQFGALLTGAVITEKVFEWPGLGSLMLNAIEGRDYPVVQGCILVIAAAYVFVNLFTDLVYAWLDPRIQYA